MLVMPQDKGTEAPFMWGAPSREFCSSSRNASGNAANDKLSAVIINLSNAGAALRAMRSYVDTAPTTDNTFLFADQARINPRRAGKEIFKVRTKKMRPNLEGRSLQPQKRIARVEATKKKKAQRKSDYKKPASVLRNNFETRFHSCMLNVLLGVNMAGRLFIKGAAVGVLGGILGIAATDLLSVSSSVAASRPPPPTVRDEPVPSFQPQPAAAPPATPQSVGAPLVSTPAPAQPSAALCEPCKPVHMYHMRDCYHVKHIKKHFKTVKAITRMAPPPPPPTPIVVIVMPAPAPPPPAPMIPLSAPVSPCASGRCGGDCDMSSLQQEPRWMGSLQQQEPRGACGVNGMPCAERVSFNDKGEATKVVLESGQSGATRPYLEMNSPPDMARTSDANQASRPTVYAANDDADGSPVSLIVPLNHSPILNDSGAASDPSGTSSHWAG